ncbi:TPA: hypothetical protein U2L31_004157 [Burkholderia contaminans]|uniref:hypothetical protein n=1 Tax=Burkholderia contaminans TaxID=488447 RepID=UPI00064A1672|nr:hypothetical protein [Burkholderia contaminans]AKM43584.1 hypothetical protein NL30_27780 [Burkholderia contaminans]HEM7877752.1 hypothetical protein [Burkholderia contaminans]
MSVVRNALAIVLFSIAGLCVIAAQMAAFMKVGHAGATAIFVAVLFAVSAVLLAAGAFAGAFRPRARGAGIVLLVAAATTALGMVGWGMLVLTPAIVDVMQQQGAYFNGRMFRFAPGAAVTGLSALVGVWLVRRG